MSNTDKQAKHTPGPWTIHGNFTEIHPANDPDGLHVIADIDPDCEVTHREANARLIAAAPELLAIVQKYLASADKPLGMSEIADIDAEARAAIAKARGE